MDIRKIKKLIELLEEFRTHSYLSDVAVGVISGFGINSYRLAFEAAVIHCKQTSQ